jgi:hypothetical protein
MIASSKLASSNTRHVYINIQDLNVMINFCVQDGIGQPDKVIYILNNINLSSHFAFALSV